MSVHSDHGEPVGTFGEEAAKLLAALQDRVDGDGHAATGDCRYCPVCRVVHVVRATPPEVREHLAAAATSLGHAVSALLATPVPDETSRTGEDGTSRDDQESP